MRARRVYETILISVKCLSRQADMMNNQNLLTSQQAGFVTERVAHVPLLRCLPTHTGEQSECRESINIILRASLLVSPIRDWILWGLSAVFVLRAIVACDFISIFKWKDTSYDGNSCVFVLYHLAQLNRIQSCKLRGRRCTNYIPYAVPCEFTNTAPHRYC